jgi:hypothetical protein
VSLPSPHLKPPMVDVGIDIDVSVVTASVLHRQRDVGEANTNPNPTYEALIFQLMAKLSNCGLPAKNSPSMISWT